MKSSPRNRAGSLVITTLITLFSSGLTVYAQEKTALVSPIAQIAEGAASPAEKSAAQIKSDYLAIYDKYTANRAVGVWMNDTWIAAIKHKVDAQVDEILKASVLQPLIVKAEMQLRQQTEALRIKFLSSTALAEKNGNHSEVYDISQRVAESVYFPKAVRENAVTFVALGDINAFTYSGLPQEFADFVVLTGLKDLFTDVHGNLQVDALASVMGHELTHVKGHHVRNQTIVAAIFYATGKIIIPGADNSGAGAPPRGGPDGHGSDSGDEGGDELDRALMEVSSSIASIGKTNHAKTTLEEKIAVSQTVKALAKEMRKAIRPDQLLEIGHRLTVATGVTPLQGAYKPNEILKAVASNFKAAMGRLSRSCETTADRGGATVENGIKGARIADALLAGGKGTDPNAIVRQAERVALETGKHPEYAEILNASDHPATAERVFQYKQFAMTETYKTLSDPFREAIFYYLGLSHQIDAINKSIEEDVSELPALNTARMARDDFTMMGRDMSRQITEHIMEEFNDPKHSKFTRFESFVDFLLTYAQSVGMPREMGNPRRLMPELADAISAAPASKMKDTALQILEQLTPKESGNGGLIRQLRAIRQSEQAAPVAAETAAAAVGEKDCGALLDAHSENRAGPAKEAADKDTRAAKRPGGTTGGKDGEGWGNGMARIGFL